MKPITIGKAVIDERVAETLQDYQECGILEDCQTLDNTINYLFEISNMFGYAANMDADKMLKLIYSLKQMRENLEALAPVKE